MVHTSTMNVLLFFLLFEVVVRQGIEQIKCCESASLQLTYCGIVRTSRLQKYKKVLNSQNYSPLFYQ